MKNTYKLLVAILMILLTTPLVSSAKFPGFLQRFQLGYTFVMNSAEYQVKQKMTLPNFYKDSTFNYDMKTSGSFGATLGTYVPLKRLGKKSNLSWSIDYMYNMMAWDSKVKMYNTDGNIYDAPFTGATVQMALPTGLDVKFGCDAMTLKNYRFCTSFGAGVLPSFSMTALDNFSSISPAFGVAPYVKAEVGIFGGICMKLRAIYAIGSLSYMDETSKKATGTTQTTLTGTSNLSVSLLVMPFSFTWHRDEWFNTY